MSIAQVASMALIALVFAGASLKLLSRSRKLAAIPVPSAEESQTPD